MSIRKLVTHILPFVHHTPMRWEWNGESFPRPVIAHPLINALSVPYQKAVSEKSQSWNLKGLAVWHADYDPFMRHIRPPLFVFGWRSLLKVKTGQVTGHTVLDRQHIPAEERSVRILWTCDREVLVSSIFVHLPPEMIADLEQ